MAKPGEKIDEGEDGVYIENGDGPNPIIAAYNEGGFNGTSVAVKLILAWVRKNRPDLLTE